MPLLSYFRKNLDIAFIVLVWVIWIAAMTVQDSWVLFAKNWFMSVTMAVGSFVAGSTSQGGGAVAFPVMTLGFEIDPKSARDFSLMIQSVGMTSASIAIFWRRIAFEKTALIFAGTGGVIGVIFGLEYVQQWFAPNPTKIFFVMFWLAFGAALLKINRLKSEVRHQALQSQSVRAKGVLLVTGIIGGMVSGLLGSGLDIFIFAVLVLGFRICETVATPTSVVLMAVNSLVGFFWRGLAQEGRAPDITPEVWNYWWVSVPIVVIGAPLGAWFISKRGRGFIVKLLLFVIVFQFIAALFIIPFDGKLVAIAVSTFVVGVLVFWLVWLAGRRFST